MASAPTRATLLGDCRIAGSGERTRDDGAAAVPFIVFDANDAIEPAFVIAHPEHVRVVWTKFPLRADDGRTRARVEIGGQGHVRYAGFTNLYGRTFTTTKRMDSVRGHLWARATSPIEMMSATASGEIFARVSTPFEAPKTIVVRGNCADVVYAPELASRPPTLQTSAVNRASSLRLYASPTSTPFAMLVASDAGIGFDVLERRADFVHVAAEEGHIGIDAWVQASDITDVSGRTRSGRHTTIAPRLRIGGPARSRVLEDTPLFVGASPTALAGAFVEKDAIVVHDAQSVKVDGREVVAFSFEDLVITAPENRSLWIARDALAPAP